MKYAVIKVSNGNFFIHAEGFTEVNKAKVSFHSLCAALWNASDVVTASVKIVDENMNGVEMYYEVIDKRPAETPVTAPAETPAEMPAMAE